MRGGEETSKRAGQRPQCCFLGCSPGTIAPQANMLESSYCFRTFGHLENEVLEDMKLGLTCASVYWCHDRVRWRRPLIISVEKQR